MTHPDAPLRSGSGGSPPGPRLTVALSYYAPYVSGLTDTARDLAEGLARRGWRVTVVATRHSRALPNHEWRNGVEVIRTPVVARIGKGTVSPTFSTVAARIAGRSSLLMLHLPLLEAGLIATLTRRAPIVALYHCDVSLPPTPLARLQTAAIDTSSRSGARRSAIVVAHSSDYARSSRVAEALLPRLEVLPPPCRVREGGAPRFRETDGRHVGFLGRIVEEKGVEHLVDAFHRLPSPKARLLIAGDFSSVAGGSVIDRVRQRIAGDQRIRVLGFLDEGRVADFYASIDVLALPSINPLEAFGRVQVEALMLGIPVVSSDLPGVRVPVSEIGLGHIVPPGDAAAIAAALDAPLPDGDRRQAAARAARGRWEASAVLRRWSSLLGRVADTPQKRVGP